MKNILFKPDLIKAIDSGQKTMTRRVLKPQPKNADKLHANSSSRHANYVRKVFWIGKNELYASYVPQFIKGEIIYIKEGFRLDKSYDLMSPNQVNDHCLVQYRLDIKIDFSIQFVNPGRWRSPLFLPEKFARKFLKITNVWIQRLNDISYEDCLNEGVVLLNSGYYKDYTNSLNVFIDPMESFFSLWKSINGEQSIILNPWVFVYEFVKCDKNGKEIEL